MKPTSGANTSRVTPSRALDRFGLGARPGDPARMEDPRAWLRAQLDGGPPRLTDARLPSTAEIGDALRALRQAGTSSEPGAAAEARARIRATEAAEVQASLGARLSSDRPFVERLVAFWSNHLCVSLATKGTVAPLAGAYEREVVRPHVLGRFEAMVLASARHPAMLLYLDNAQSIGPGSQAARARRGGGSPRGLNENYARELLELHTLGVDGGYTQEDVGELARVLTGWTIAGVAPGATLRALARRDAETGEIGFTFAPALHEPGPRRVLGRRYPEGGVEQGEAVIRDLCRHPSTARFLATKLVGHFVSDEPPASAVDRVARVFSSTDGDLGEVAQALIGLEEAWEPDRRKLRTPQDWTVAVFRALGARETPEAMPAILRQLRQPLWAPPSPKGWGDTVREWADSDSLMNRAELARTVAGRAGPRQDPAALVRLTAPPPGDPIHSLAQDESIPREDRLALVLAGPAFQWR